MTVQVIKYINPDADAGYVCSHPGSCGNFDTYDCPGVESGTCLCGTTLDGDAYCFALPVKSNCWDLQECSADSPCLDLEMLCVVNTCCGGPGTGRCLDAMSGVCPNPAAGLRHRAAGKARGGDLPCGAFKKC